MLMPGKSSAGQVGVNRGLWLSNIVAKRVVAGVAAQDKIPVRLAQSTDATQMVGIGERACRRAAGDDFEDHYLPIKAIVS